MKDMIAKIVDTEQKAREMTENTAHQKVTVEQEISELKKTIKKDYLNRARKRIKINEKEEQRQADERWEKIEKDQTEISKAMDQMYQSKKTEWVDKILNNILGE